MSKTIIIPSNPADLKRINKLVDEGVDALTKIAGNQAEFKDVATVIKDEFKLPTSFINRLIRTKYKGNIDKVEAENDDFMELYTKVVS
jgi:hypothetical protein